MIDYAWKILVALMATNLACTPIVLAQPIPTQSDIGYRIIAGHEKFSFHVGWSTFWKDRCLAVKSWSAALQATESYQYHHSLAYSKHQYVQQQLSLLDSKTPTEQMLRRNRHYIRFDQLEKSPKPTIPFLPCKPKLAKLQTSTAFFEASVSAALQNSFDIKSLSALRTAAGLCRKASNPEKAKQADQAYTFAWNVAFAQMMFPAGPERSNSEIGFYSIYFTYFPSPSQMMPCRIRAIETPAFGQARGKWKFEDTQSLDWMLGILPI